VKDRLIVLALPSSETSAVAAIKANGIPLCIPRLFCTGPNPFEDAT
jgi:hypothetical protein